MYKTYLMCVKDQHLMATIEDISCQVIPINLHKTVNLTNTCYINERMRFPHVKYN